MKKYKQIPLTQEKYAIVDAEYYDYLNQWKWRASKKRYVLCSKKYKKE